MTALAPDRLRPSLAWEGAGHPTSFNNLDPA